MRLAAYVLLLGLCAGPVFAQDSSSPPKIIDAGATWVIETDAVPSSTTVRKHKSLFSAAIYPEKLIRIEQPVVDVGTTGVKVSAGKQFIEYRLINGRAVYCSTKTLDFLKDGGSIFYMRKSGTYACLVDTDGDGKLDGVYEILSRLMSGTPIITHGKDSGYESINPVSFSVLDRHEFDNPMTIDLLWVAGNGASDWVGCTPNVTAKNGEALSLSNVVGLEKGHVPGTFAYLNMTFSVSSPESKVIDVKIDKTGHGAVMQTRGERVQFGPPASVG